MIKKKQYIQAIFTSTNIQKTVDEFIRKEIEDDTLFKLDELYNIIKYQYSSYEKERIKFKALITLINNNISPKLIYRIFKTYTNDNILKSYKIIFYKNLYFTEENAFKLAQQYISDNDLIKIIGLMRQLNINNTNNNMLFKTNTFELLDNYKNMKLDKQHLDLAEGRVTFLNNTDAIIRTDQFNYQKKVLYFSY
jgi:hypothetical protein